MTFDRCWRPRARWRSSAREALTRLRETTEVTALLGEQNVTFALPHADRVSWLEHARMISEGNPARFAEEMGARCL